MRRTNGVEYSFQVDEFRKHCLINGLDDIGLTLKHDAEITAFEKVRTEKFPWLDGIGYRGKIPLCVVPCCWGSCALELTVVRLQWRGAEARLVEAGQRRDIKLTQYQSARVALFRHLVPALGTPRTTSPACRNGVAAFYVRPAPCRQPADPKAKMPPFILAWYTEIALVLRACQGGNCVRGWRERRRTRHDAASALECIFARKVVSVTLKQF